MCAGSGGDLISISDDDEKKVGSPAMAKVIKAHITGNVWKIEAKVGDKVEEGTQVAILESMKMEMPVESEEEGTITAVIAKEGQAIKEGEVMFELA